MLQLKSVLISAMFLAALSVVMVAQSSVTGTPPFGSFQSGPFGTLNLGNLNVHIEIPIIAKAGRGTPFTYSLIYDSTVWTPVTSGSTTSWQNATGFGWLPKTPVYGGSITTKVIQTKCNGQWTPDTMIQTYTDPSGTTHPVGIAEDPCDLGILEQMTSRDGSGWTINYQLGALWTTSRDGQTYSIIPSTGYTDTNGNQIMPNGNAYTDTLGKTVLTVSGTNPVSYTWTNPQGTTSSTKVYYTTYQIKSGFGCSTVNDVTIANVPLITSIVLPDNSSYAFDYEHTYNNPSYRTGRLASMTLPTGGQINYSYSGGDTGTGIECVDGTTSGLTITTPDSSTGWIYSRTAGTSPAWTTKMTDPVGNDTVINLQGIYETSRYAYQGPQSANVLLKTLTTCYNRDYHNVCPATVSQPFSRRDVTTTWPGGQQSNILTIYDTFGNPSTISEADHAAGVPGNPFRSVGINYDTNFDGPLLYDRPISIAVSGFGGTGSSLTQYGYDETTPTASGITTQHTGVTCPQGAPHCRGNITSITYTTAGSNTLKRTFTYYDTGEVRTAVDVNGGTTTYAYGSGSCAGAFPTTLTFPVTTLSESMTWNCDGGVMTQLTDPNGNQQDLTYNDPNFWRTTSATDLGGNLTTTAYGTSPLSTENSLNFNGAVSTRDILTSLDSLGRTQFQQQKQAQGSSTFDSVQYVYDGRGMQYKVSMPYAGSARQTMPVNWPVTTWSYDALGRTTQVQDGGNGTIGWQFLDNDILQTIASPAKQRQYEYDSAGRLTSVCEVTSGTQNAPAGTCTQNHPQTGYWTKYTYDVLDDLTGVAQNAQSITNNQTRTYTYDELGRLTSETNPETNNLSYTYVYDNDSTCGTSNGDLVKRTDVVGNVTCYAYDKMHRLTSVTYPSGSYHANTPTKCYVYDAATVNSVAMANAKGRLAEAYTGTGTSCPLASKTTDIGLSYSARGEVAAVYESTSHSGGYYNVGATYWPHGIINQLTSNIAGLPTISYGSSGGVSGLDGEGRLLQVTASSGQSPVTGVTYTNTNNTQPPEPIGSLTNVTYGSVDSDSFQYDFNTGRPTQYKFNVGTSQSVTGVLGWNTNGTLSSLNITDQLNASNSQNCAFQFDDLVRLNSANCGSSIWSQTFGYDAYGNISKAVPQGSTGVSFLSTYSSTTNATNRLTAISTSTPTYDNNGNLTYDAVHNLGWDADGNMINVDSTAVAITYDAFDRAVEQNRGGSYTEIVYAPFGGKLALMNGSTLVKAFAPLPSGATAVYAAGTTGPLFYRHSDWLGSSRLASTQGRTAYYDVAYAPFGENYNGMGTQDLNYAGLNQDTITGYYDALFREHSPVQGRWLSPDPAGMAPVDLTNPQSWNRYAYVLNNPLGLVDPQGLDCIYLQVWWGDRSHWVLFDGSCGSTGSGGNPTPVGVDGGGGGGGGAANNPTLPKCSSLGPLGVLAAGLSLASQWSGTGYTLGVNGNGLKANVVGADIAASVALVSDPAGNVGVARSLSITPSVGARSYGGGVIIGGSTFSDLSGYSSYSNVNFTTTFGAGLATGFTESSNSSGLTTTAYLGFGTGGSVGAKGLSLTNNVQAFCKQ